MISFTHSFSELLESFTMCPEGYRVYSQVYSANQPKLNPFISCPKSISIIFLLLTLSSCAMPDQALNGLHAYLIWVLHRYTFFTDHSGLECCYLPKFSCIFEYRAKSFSPCLYDTHLIMFSSFHLQHLLFRKAFPKCMIGILWESKIVYTVQIYAFILVSIRKRINNISDIMV